MARIFIYDGREFPDPDETLSVDEVRQSMANFFPELSNASTSESKKGEDKVFTFTKRVGTKGSMRTAEHYLKLLDENPNTIVGFTLAAAAVYAARYGICEAEHKSTDECKRIARDLRGRYGETLTTDEVRKEMNVGKDSR